MFYDNVLKICEMRGVKPTKVLEEIGASTGNISKWKTGSVPNVDLALRFARHIGVSLDYLVTGEEFHAEPLESTPVSEFEKDWLSLARSIPESKRAMCVDFLKTHAVSEKYVDKKKR
jgi:transcriptional regulator with XRE-family HTH domain